MATTSADRRSRARAHFRAMVWALALILGGALVAPLGGYAYVAYAQEEPAWQEQNPRGETWGNARAGGEGYTSASGPYTTNSLIANGGENWRNLRNGPVAWLTPWLMALSLVALLAVYVFAGPHRIEGPLSGRKVKRWELWERIMHWFVAVTFIILAITGLSLLFGRAVLIPLLGQGGFSAWAQFSLWLHNFIGPFFGVGILAMLITWARNNILKAVDIAWFRKGGGIFTKQHVSAGKLNGGEKVWFWFVVIGGGIVVITGLILDFPNFGQSRETMQLANLIHAVLAILWIAISFGHIYLGVIGAQGALEGMTTGYVSEEWAYEHHDLWLEQLRAQEDEGPERPQATPGAAAHGPAQREP